MIQNLSKEVAVASGAVGEGGSSAEPVAVWDGYVIHVREEGVSLGQDHGIQAIRASLLHALDEKLHIHWQLLVDKNKSNVIPLGCVWQWQQVVWMEDEVLEKSLIWEQRIFGWQACFFEIVMVFQQALQTVKSWAISLIWNYSHQHLHKLFPLNASSIWLMPFDVWIQPCYFLIRWSSSKDGGNRLLQWLCRNSSDKMFWLKLSSTLFILRVLSLFSLNLKSILLN